MILEFEVKGRNQKMKDTSQLVEFEFKESVLIAHVTGEIDHHSALCVREAVDKQIFSKRPSKLLLELSHVGFMDSSGLGLIMGRYTLMKKLGGSTALLDPSEAIMRIVSLAGLERIVKIERTKIGREAK